MRKSAKCTIIISAIIGVLLGLYLVFGYVRTPVIHGTVLDAETKQPVENAWVTGTLSLKVATIQGDIHVHPAFAPAHLRTNKEGKFIIPRKSFRQPIPPLGFGMNVEGCRVTVETKNDKQGEISLKPSFWKWWTEVTIYVKPTLMTEGEYDSYLQSLFRYCTTGRSGVEVPVAKEGCDAWELDYVITKHENFIAKLDKPDSGEKRTYFKGSLYHLAYLFEMKGDLRKALDTFRILKEHDKKHNISFFLNEYERKMSELQEKLNN